MYNKTTRFLLPLVLITTEMKEFPLKKLESFGFKNAFIGDMGEELQSYKWYKGKNRHLFLLFEVDDKKTFSKIEEVYKEFDIWVDYYDIGSNHVMHIFKVRETYVKDILNFQLGMYSRLSQTLKNRYTNELTKGIVNKLESAQRRMGEIYGIDIPNNQEFMSKPILKEEIYRYK